MGLWPVKSAGGVATWRPPGRRGGRGTLLAAGDDLQGVFGVTLYHRVVAFGQLADGGDGGLRVGANSDKDLQSPIGLLRVGGLEPVRNRWDRVLADGDQSRVAVKYCRRRALWGVCHFHQR